MTFLVLLVVILLSSPRQAPATLTAEDIAVLTAAIDHRLRPEYLRLRPPASSADSVLRVIDRTPPNCVPGRPIEPPGCLQSRDVGLLTRTTGNRMFAAHLTPAIAAELASAFQKANEHASAVPDGRLKNVTLVPAGAPSPQVVVSRPGYVDGRHALVYLSFVCGGLCGEGHFILLEKQADIWHVRDVGHLWVS